MRSLLLCSRPPWPLLGGDRIRTWHLARALADLGKVGVVATRSPLESAGDIAEGLPFVEPITLVPLTASAPRRVLGAVRSGACLQQALYDAPEAREAVVTAIRRFEPDLIVAHLVRTVPWVPEDSPPLLVDVQDALSAQYADARSVPGWRAWAVALERGRIHHAEAEAVGRADAVSFISDQDRRRVAGEAGHVLPAVVDLDAFAPGEPATKPVVGFVGNLSTAANADMVWYLARDIWPLVRRARADAELHVCGVGAGPALRRLEGADGLHYRGPVDDVAETLRGFAVTVCPQRFGSGVQNKVLQSLACGVPSVVTPTVAAALDPGAVAGLLVGASATAFAEAILQLLDDAELRASKGAGGRGYVQAHHAPAVLLEALRRAAEAAQAGGSGTSATSGAG